MAVICTTRPACARQGSSTSPSAANETGYSILAGARILVVGDVMLDRYWFGDVTRISPEAPVPVVKINRQEERLGGAANVARNAAALGANSTLLSVIGDDEAGAAVARLLQADGIDASLHRTPRWRPSSSCASSAVSNSYCALISKRRPVMPCWPTSWTASMPCWRITRW